MRFSRIYLLFDKLSFLWQVAGVLLLTSALLYLSQNDDTQKAKHIQEIIQDNVYDIEKAANSEIQRLKTDIKNNTLNIDQVLRGYPYPHFVFENDSLLFWSTHNFVVPKTNLVSQKIIENHRGIFWNLSDIWKNEQGKTLRVHIFIPIVEDNSEYYKQELNYNEYLFPTQLASVSLKPNENFQAIYDTKGTVLWFISIPKSDDFLSSRDIFLALIMGLSAFILFFGLVRKSLKMRRTARVYKGFYLFILALLILRIFF